MWWEAGQSRMLVILNIELKCTSKYYYFIVIINILGSQVFLY